MSFGAPDEDLYQLADQYDGVAGPAPANASPVPMPEPEVQPVEPSALDNLDVDAAANNLAAVGQQPSAAPAEGAPAPAVPETPPVDPLTIAPPQPPALTGDPEKDTQANLQYQRDLATHFGTREQEIQRRAQGEHAKQAAKELEVAKEHERQRQAAVAERIKQRATEQKYINDTVAARVEAQKDLEGANWADKHAGRAAFATIFGALAQGLNNVAAIQSGHAPTAENEGAKAIDRLIQHDYDVKKQRIASMSESLLEARHGFKDNEDNFRAAMNDLDADTSAKYKLVAKEAEMRLRQQGASDDDIKQNAFVRNALTQSAKAEQQILDREQTHRDTREGHEATNKLAEAHLGLQERQIDATIADRQANRGERRREFDERQADRREARAAAAAAKKEKAEDKEDSTAVRAGKNDPSGKKAGEVIGHVPTGRGGAQGFATRDADYALAIERLEKLRDHVIKYGTRPLGPAVIADRDSIYKNALGSVITVSPMGKNEEAQHIEADSLGPSGGISVRAANLKAIEAKIAETKDQRQQYRDQTLTPIEGGKGEPEPKKAAAVKGESHDFLDDLLDEGK